MSQRVIFASSDRSAKLARHIIGVWRSLVARFVRDEEAVGSNPATPTTATPTTATPTTATPTKEIAGQRPISLISPRRSLDFDVRFWERNGSGS
jgi:hypothetical protein